MTVDHEVLAGLRGRDLLGLADLSAAEIGALLRLAHHYKRTGERNNLLDRREIGMLFNVSSTRTRVSFQVAARHLGAHAEHYRAEDLRLAVAETLEDTGKVLSRYLDALILRHYDMTRYGEGHAALTMLAERSPVPVINALDDHEHPCQVLADLMTVQELHGPDPTAPRVVFTWAYSSRAKTPGVPHSWLLAAGALGMNLTVAHPPEFPLDAEYVKRSAALAQDSGGRIEYVDDMREAVRDADVVYVQSWKCLSREGADEAARREAHRDWRVSTEVMDLAAPHAVYMDCLPSNRGEEVDAEVKDGPRSIIFDQAENRLHAQKAILAALLAPAGSALSGDPDGGLLR
ncbi:ornithine carbamoyltransferase [Actinoplanes lobatus]|uniref:Ornithine carbamoyltransferase n=1 Tax=Actinoplanes lobatus TaxID=113568 RepID=A0A7W7MEM2_9ACTN|nr:ornithine carbamoyltransferase [Actinoplanes lobatus]MBB4747454.1 ornithine carbamoyltransferase [Actinoplanes lobatus]GGN78634.1 ornithine carbamoyltransferase [Actinoplanes lobatus]GIE45545.1 ornithine carbamoyltransferase [Actinoplanes lobatus]